MLLGTACLLAFIAFIGIRTSPRREAVGRVRLAETHTAFASLFASMAGNWAKASNAVSLESSVASGFPLAKRLYIRRPNRTIASGVPAPKNTPQAAVATFNPMAPPITETAKVINPIAVPAPATPASGSRLGRVVWPRSTCVKSGIDNHLEVPSHRLCNIWLNDQHYEPKKEGTDEIICSN